MSRQNIEKFRNLLLEKKKEVESTLNKMHDNQTGSQSMYQPTELSNYDNHPAELGTELFITEMNNALIVHEENILNEINDALDRIESGNYGECFFCGREIPDERLEAIPYARTCIECEESKTAGLNDLKKDRPVEEQVWDAPFGRKYFNSREDDEYEGLDYLNDLMKYGSSDTPQDMGGYEDYEEFYTNEIDRQGIVDPMDRISNEQYKRQLPD